MKTRNRAVKENFCLPHVLKYGSECESQKSIGRKFYVTVFVGFCKKYNGLIGNSPVPYL